MLAILPAADETCHVSDETRAELAKTVHDSRALRGLNDAQKSVIVALDGLRALKGHVYEGPYVAERSRFSHFAENCDVCDSLCCTLEQPTEPTSDMFSCLFSKGRLQFSWPATSKIKQFLFS